MKFIYIPFVSTPDTLIGGYSLIGITGIEPVSLFTTDIDTTPIGGLEPMAMFTTDIDTVPITSNSSLTMSINGISTATLPLQGVG